MNNKKEEEKHINADQKTEIENRITKKNQPS